MPRQRLEDVANVGVSDAHTLLRYAPGQVRTSLRKRCAFHTKRMNRINWACKRAACASMSANAALWLALPTYNDYIIGRFVAASRVSSRRIAHSRAVSRPVATGRRGRASYCPIVWAMVHLVGAALLPGS